MPLSDSNILSSHFAPPKPQQGSVVDVIYADFDSFPKDRTALIDDVTGARLSFADLKRLTGNVASGLTKRGFGKGQVLSLFGANCIENAPIAHGALVTGGTIHLMSPVASLDQLRFHFSLVSPQVIVTTTKGAQAVIEVVRAATLPVQDIFVIGDAVKGCRRAEELLEDPGDANPWGQVEIDPEEDVAVLMQTGGTTGMSKTIMLTHESVKMAILEGSYSVNRSREHDLSLGYIPFSYVLSFMLLYSGCLRLGCGVVNITVLQPEALLRAIEKYKITRLGLTPAVTGALRACPYFGKADLTSVHEILIGAAVTTTQMEKVVRKAFEAKAPAVNLYQAYAMTEMAGGVSWYPHPSDPNFKRKLGSSGIVQPNVELRVVSCDDQHRLCGPGQPGEIQIRSPRLMKGYFKDEEGTRNVIIDGWFHTGDFGYFDEDEYIFVLDRVQDLIHNKDGIVVPTHVETVLRSHPAIRDCAVVGRSSGTSDEPVTVAFVVKDGDLTEEEVRRFAAASLASHEQLFGGVRFVASIPKSSGGKMLRRLLIESA